MYKVTSANEAVTYEPPGHYDVRCTNLHKPDQVNDGEISLGLSHFLPGGGAEMAPAPVEMFYYIVEGEMTVTTGEDGKAHVLHAGDSIRFMPGTQRAPKNTGIHVAEMLVMMLSK